MFKKGSAPYGCRTTHNSRALGASPLSKVRRLEGETVVCVQTTQDKDRVSGDSKCPEAAETEAWSAASHPGQGSRGVKGGRVVTGRAWGDNGGR